MTQGNLNFWSIFMKKFFLWMSGASIFVCSFACIQADETPNDTEISYVANANDHSAFFHHEKKELPCEKDFDCDSLFCECMPFFTGTVSTAQFQNNLITIGDPPFTIPSTNGVFNIPIIFSDGFGGGFTVKDQPLYNNNCQLIAPGGRVDICHCGWFKVSFFGEILNTITLDQSQSGDVEIFLRSPILGDIFVGSVSPGTLSPLPLAVTDYRYVSRKPHCCAPMYFALEISNVFTTNPNEFVQFSPNSKITIERVGPCSCCPKAKPCCPKLCKTLTCEREKDKD